ncbi:YopX family protein [Campylobacter sp. CN_NE3]|uniref:YopX family protein n=1 Tax=Campylobacter sp. CN_NE3 TaxID=2984149 RepID=UPI0022E9E1A2|nr:YopX family protein [Campylobacter sp. CN_NE3]MDA3069379.1 YopX family protein [Campylobacter sp. CN_NE3]
MSRKIKFRAWSKFPKMFLDMEDACYYLLPFGKLVQITLDKRNRAIHRELDVVVQLYTGLKDKHGKEIYEGDIVKIDDYIGGDDETDSVNLLEVRFVFGKFIADLPGQFGKLDLTEINRTCEVVGNIYQNPELLGE